MDMAERPDLRVIEGGGDIVGFLDRLSAMAKAGKIEAIAVAVVETDGVTGTGLAFRDADALWARTLGAVTSLQHEILTGALSFEP